MTTHALDGLSPIHPGAFLRDELETLGASARQFARHLGVPPNAVTGIKKEERSISARMDIRLGRAFGATPEYWMNLQAIYDLKRARAEMPPETMEIGRFAVA